MRLFRASSRPLFGLLRAVTAAPPYFIQSKSVCSFTRTSGLNKLEGTDCPHARRMSSCAACHQLFSAGNVNDDSVVIDALSVAYPFSSTEATSRLLQDSRSRLALNGVDGLEQAAHFTEEILLAQQRNDSNDKKKPLILFVCGHNAGRSQMAEAWLRHYAGDQALSMSAGSGPSDHVNPMAVEAMKEAGIDIGKHFPKPLSEGIVQASNQSITMGCGDACPKLPFVTYSDWLLPDPHGEGLDMVRKVRDDIEEQVLALCSELQIDVRK